MPVARVWCSVHHANDDEKAVGCFNTCSIYSVMSTQPLSHISQTWEYEEVFLNFLFIFAAPLLKSSQAEPASTCPLPAGTFGDVN